MAANGDNASRRGQTLDVLRLVDTAPSLIHTGRPDGYLDFFNQTWLSVRREAAGGFAGLELDSGHPSR